MNINIKNIDALQLLQSLDDKSVDLILTDPPYYKLLNVDWDNQWKTKEDYLIWLETIIKECQRVLKDNGSFYMFCSAEMSWYVEGLIRKYFNVLNHIRWDKPIIANGKPCTALTIKKESLRKWLSYSEEIIFAEQFSQCIRCNGDTKGTLFSPIYSYLNSQRIKRGFTIKRINELCGVKARANHYFGSHQFELISEEHYTKLRKHMDLKPYDEIIAEYEALHRTFKLTSDKPYNNTWCFKQTPTRKGRHPCEKPEDLISHIIDASSNENDLVVDPFCGSCVVPKCCDKMNRRCIAGDLDDTYLNHQQYISCSSYHNI